MSKFLDIDFAGDCARCVWDDPDNEGQTSCVVCGTKRDKKNAANGIPKRMLIEQLRTGPLERGIAS